MPPAWVELTRHAWSTTDACTSLCILDTVLEAAGLRLESHLLVEHKGQEQGKSQKITDGVGRSRPCKAKACTQGTRSACGMRVTDMLLARRLL